MSAPVLFATHELKNGQFMAVATLNVEKTLNSLSLDMIDLLLPQLESWKTDDSVAFVLFQGAGDRAFCAGGDIQNLYHDMVDSPGGPCTYCDAFFEREYRLDHLIHTYPKPTVVWGHGIVMGGGLGILSACRYRIGTQKTRIAMPEITIGLFPDAGATWTFTRMDSHWAYFLAWTGCSINGLDAQQVGLIDHLISAELKDLFVEQLLNQDWLMSSEQTLELVIEDLVKQSSGFPEGKVKIHDSLVREIMTQCLDDANPVAAFKQRLPKLVGDSWLEKAGRAFANGTPTTAHIIHEQFQRARKMSLEEMFQMELTLAVQCSRHPDFAEGVRALLIDKDNNPNWHYSEMGEVPASWIEEHFNEPWDQNPLANLTIN